MRNAYLCGIGALLLLSAGVAFSQTGAGLLVRHRAPNDRALYFALADIQAEFSEMQTQRRITTRLLEGGEYSINARVLNSPEPNPQVHKTTIEIYFVRDGSGTLVTGGTSADRAMQGGVERIVKAGDVIFIPPGVPHRFSAVSGLSYLNVHFGGTD